MEMKPLSCRLRTKLLGQMGLCLLLEIFLIGIAAARELTPIEKAMQALGAKTSSRSARGTTPAAQSSSSLSVAPASTSENAQAQATPTLTIVPSLGEVKLPEQPLLVNASSNSLPSLIQAAQSNSPASAAEPNQRASLIQTGIDPLALTVTATAETIVLSWSNTATAWEKFAGYEILKAVWGEDLLPAFPPALALTTYQDVTVTPGTTYQYQVLALDSTGNTLLASHTLTSQLAPSFPPETPGFLEGSNEDERVRLKWKPVSRTSFNLSGYIVLRTPQEEEAWTCITPALVSREEYYDETGQWGKDYRYQVVAVDVKGQTSTASDAVTAHARPRSRNGLILTSTAYRGLGHDDMGFNADLQFTYYIGTLYGEQDKELSRWPLYLDPISLWLLSGDIKFTFLTEKQIPVSVALGSKEGLLLFLRQQSSTKSETFSFTEKSELNYLWGGYAALSRSLGDWGLHAGYIQGNWGNPIFYLSKYMEPESMRHLFYFGVDFPIVRRMNAALEVLYPLNDKYLSPQNPFLVNLHVDRLFNFDIAFIHWTRAWALLGYFNLRFTIFPGE